MTGGSRAPGPEIRVPGLPAVYWVNLFIGCGGLALAAALADFRAPYLLFLFSAVTLFGVVGVFDRRARLTLSPAGIRYARWGPRVVPWHEFTGYRPVRWRGNPYVQLVPHRPGHLRRGFSRLGRLDNRAARLIGAPAFGIAVTPLAISERALEQTIAAYLPREPDA